jgi:hypothetical protein
MATAIRNICWDNHEKHLFSPHSNIWTTVYLLWCVVVCTFVGIYVYCLCTYICLYVYVLVNVPTSCVLYLYPIYSNVCVYLLYLRCELSHVLLQPDIHIFRTVKMCSQISWNPLSAMNWTYERDGHRPWKPYIDRVSTVARISRQTSKKCSWCAGQNHWYWVADTRSTTVKTTELSTLP